MTRAVSAPQLPGGASQLCSGCFLGSGCSTAGKVLQAWQVPLAALPKHLPEVEDKMASSQVGAAGA